MCPLALSTLFGTVCILIISSNCFCQLICIVHIYNPLDCNDGDLKLVGGSNDMEGTVEICFDDLWGLISDSNWGDTDAIVVCSQLGLETRCE